jgi:isoleucyl-tRNA synthetase
MNKLKVKNFQEKVNIPELEHQVLKYWDETEAFEKSVSNRPENNRYVFYDGPPFATGLPHYGHILASTIKDVVPRYFTMKGFRVDRVWGWDCHGIPIENMIEKELGLKGGKKGIEEMGIGKFNEACRSAILRFDTEWEKVINRIGRWVDFKHSYKTMDATYMESVWWAFKSLSDKGHVYEGRKVILYCPRCATPLSNFEIAMDNSYVDVTEASTVYKYKVVGEADTYLLAWSTTPWTKLATPALAVNPNLTYVKVKQNQEFYILAESTLKILKDDPYEIIDRRQGSSLQGMAFEGHYNFFPKSKAGEKAFIVVADDYVSDTEGTGIVTLAIYGEDDYRVMKKFGIQMVEHVDPDGKLKAEVTPWAGMFILKANSLIDADLSERGLVYKEEQLSHSVPVCYRCETRLYYAPVPAWFIDIAKMKPDMIAQNENINWYPDHLKYGRFGKGLETAPDWNISRSRYWGTPMPVWRNAKTGQMRIIGSIAELQNWAVDKEAAEKITNLHREYLDDLEIWVDDAKTEKGKRIPEVFDCWVESGSMPYASIHYPFENREKFEKSHPAQFIAEYIAQTRAWFYTLHVMSVGIFGKNTFENAVTTGTILAEDGNKMSKSKKNYPDPSLLFEKYGVDALRFYLMSSVVMKAENLNFSESSVRDVYQKLISILWNLLAFYKLYVTGDPVDKLPELTNVLDKWIVSRTMGLIKSVTGSMDGYDMVNSCRLISDYTADLSTWYLRRSRDRIRTDLISQQVFGWVLDKIARVIAPVTPFISEILYQNLYQDVQSVHLTDWPVYEDKLINADLENDMQNVRAVVEKILAKRKEVNIPVRQALNLVTVGYPGKPFSQDLLEVIKSEVNIKRIVINTGEKDITAELDTVLTPELLMEGRTRELIRQVQTLRKERSCTIQEHILLTLPDEYKLFSPELLNLVKKETLADQIIWGNNLAISTG